MTSVRLVLLTVVTAACVHADEHINIADKCAIIQAKIGQTCIPTVCADRNTSCPLIPDVLCASDECGCIVAFFAVINQSGRHARIDVTDLCKSAAEIREACDLMERVLAGEAESCDLVASDPDILLRVFRGLNKLSIDKLKRTISSLESAFPRDRTPAMEKRRRYLRSELAALEERMRRRGFDAVHRVATHVGNVSAASSWEAQKELSRRKDVIHQWTTKQQRVQILDESVSMSKLIASARMASRKYAVDNRGNIIGSQLPIYGNILNSKAAPDYGTVNIRISGKGQKQHAMDRLTPERPAGSVMTSLCSRSGNAVLPLSSYIIAACVAFTVCFHNQNRFCVAGISRDGKMWINDSGNGYKIMELYNQLMHIVLDAPLMHEAGEDGDASLRLMSLASQTAALGMDLYSKIVGESPTASATESLAGFVLDWNIADDLTEFLF